MCRKGAWQDLAPAELRERTIRENTRNTATEALATTAAARNDTRESRVLRDLGATAAAGAIANHYVGPVGGWCAAPEAWSSNTLSQPALFGRDELVVETPAQPMRLMSVNGYVRPRIFGEQDLVRMGGPASAVAVSTQEIFFEDRR